MKFQIIINGSIEYRNLASIRQLLTASTTPLGDKLQRPGEDHRIAGRPADPRHGVKTKKLRWCPQANKMIENPESTN